MAVAPFEIFVPGRVCLLGEHSDWAGGFRKGEHVDSLHPGQCLVYGTDVGLHATVSATAPAAAVATEADGSAPGTVFTYTCATKSDTSQRTWNLRDLAALKQEAAEGGFYSYVAGTVAVLVEDFLPRSAKTYGSIDVLNHTVSMPMKKGLSSSAAVCVLIAKAFSQLYGLGLDVNAIMDVAYRGERMTPSMCGRMDQCCAFGSRFVSMTFDGDSVKAEEVPCPTRLYFVVADLGGFKDTAVILSSLSAAYPVPQSPVHAKVHTFLGALSWQFVEEAKRVIALGDARALGQVFDAAQADFDHHLEPACPSQLGSPRLHEILTHPLVRPHVLGGKGVGSQGDGSVQFVCADETSQRLAAEALKAIGCTPFTFSIGGASD